MSEWMPTYWIEKLLCGFFLRKLKYNFKLYLFTVKETLPPVCLVWRASLILLLICRTCSICILLYLFSKVILPVRVSRAQVILAAITSLSSIARLSSSWRQTESHSTSLGDSFSLPAAVQNLCLCASADTLSVPHGVQQLCVSCLRTIGNCLQYGLQELLFFSCFAELKWTPF